MMYERLKKNRGLFLGVSSFLVFFLGYIAINYAIQTQTLQSVNYARVVSEINNNIANATTKDPKISKSLKQLANGKLVDGLDKKQTAPSIADFLSPASTPINQIITDFDSGNLPKAKSGMQNINKLVGDKRDKKLALSKSLQIVTAILAALLYFVVLLPLILRVNESQETKIASESETEGIMNTVSEGLFLLNSDHEIGIQQSASLKQMFKLERDLDGNFFDFIADYVTKGNVQIAKDYIELLFGDRVKEKLVEDLNPLNNVEINLVRRDGSFESRYLDFKFKRVLIDGKLSHLLGSVTDVTKQVLLEQQLRESKEEQEAQLDLLMSILHVDNRQLKMFINTSDETLNQINQTLEAKGHSDSEIRKKLTEVTRDVHRLKGDAAALGLHKFEFTAHSFEEEIAKAKAENKTITGKELLPTITKLRDLFTEQESMKTLMEKLSNAMSNNEAALETFSTNSIATYADADTETTDATSVNKDANEESTQESVEQTTEQAATSDTDKHNAELINNLNSLTETVSDRNNVDVNFNSTGLSHTEVPEHLEEIVQSALVQFIRNSIAHGGESVDIRTNKGKSPALNIKTEFKKLNDSYKLIVRDDGKGIDAQEVFNKAVKLGFISESQAKKLEDKKALSLIFKSGFSSDADDPTLDSGRGVGLDVVLQLTKQEGGSISAQYAKEKYCQFTLTFPITA